MICEEVQWSTKSLFFLNVLARGLFKRGLRHIWLNLEEAIDAIQAAYLGKSFDNFGEKHFLHGCRYWSGEKIQTYSAQMRSKHTLMLLKMFFYKIGHEMDPETRSSLFMIGWYQMVRMK